MLTGERFMKMYWDSDPQAGGENEEFIGYHDALKHDVDMNGYKLEDFYPNSKS
jgi:hypothetical protein